MNSLSEFSGITRTILAAAVLTTVIAGCNRKDATDQPTASTSQSGMPPSAGMTGATPAAATGSTTVADAGAGATGATPPSSGMSTSSDSKAGNSSGMSGASTGTDSTTSGAAATGSSASGAGAALTDSQIEGILMTANNAEIDAGKLAESKSKNAKVKDFARTMVKQHTDVNQQVAALSKKMQMSPGESDMTAALKEDAGKAAAALKAADGTAFDKAYIDSQVADHEKVLQTIDTNLMPNAKSPELAQLLKKVRPAVSTHLDHAKTLQASMK